VTTCAKESSRFWRNFLRDNSARFRVKTLPSRQHQSTGG
jgi:hypothetical protein